MERRVDGALEEVAAGLYRLEELVRGFERLRPKGRIAELPVELVEGPPDFRVDRSADAPRVRACARHAGHDAPWIVEIEGETLGDRRDAPRVLGGRHRLLEDRRQPLPVDVARARRHGSQVELDEEPYVEKARHRFGALEIAARPEERVGHTGEHQAGSPARAHVSLLAPPGELLTTRLPCRSATRVSAPGMTRTVSPQRMNGRRSMCRPSRWPSTKVGCCESWIVGCAM